MYSYRIEQALRATTILHKDQVRKGAIPLPYVSHLFAVAIIAIDYTQDEDVLIAALLHDTLEDTDYTPKELEDDFGGKVREIVEALSEPQNTETKTYTWKESKQRYAKQLKTASQEALLISAADKIHNMRSMVEEYYDDHTRFLKEFNGSLEDRLELYQDIADVLNRSLKSDILNEFNHVFSEYKNFISDVQKSKEGNEGY
ncbi:MAG: (p)ppGpp synthase/HD superfamily hydrolase [Acidimicrobiales bacterium]|jgi:(p)ppGpp synthase/HD superfamily hydrolase